MTPPRELLLQRHAAAAPKLDAIRRAAVRELNNQETKEQSFPTFFVAWLLRCSNKLWFELVWPCRRTWAGLATIWLALTVFNAVHSERAPIVVTKTASPVALRLAFLEQQKILNEIIGPSAPMSPAEQQAAQRKARDTDAGISGIGNIWQETCKPRCP